MLIGSDREAHKLHTIIDHNSDICILLDHHMDTRKLQTLTKNNRQIISGYTIYGIPSIKRGILILVKKRSGCKISNVESLANNDILSFIITMPDMSVIHTTAIYAPSADLSTFWDTVNDTVNKGDIENKLIMGDFNVTLDHDMDAYGYKTDPHPKSRRVINGWLENETLIDTYRHFNPDTKSYTFRNKKCKLKSRLDYCLSSPTLIPYIKNISHLSNNYLNTDHATLVVDLDFTSSTRGKGTFRSPPNAHNDPIYTRLIKNTIKTAIYSCIKPNIKTDLEIGLLESRIQLEEELHQIETVIPNWNTTIRQNTLRHTIANLLSNEPSNSTLIDRDLTISKPNLLEFILQKMKEETITFSKKKKKKKEEKKGNKAKGETPRPYL